jgi:cobalt-zinc-cadmium efflux system outer membrane protein
MGLVRSLIGFSCAMSVALSAVPGRANSGPWTLDSATEFALQRSPRMRSAQAAREVALAYRAFGRVPRVGNPQLNLRAMVGKPDDPAATYSLLFGLPFDVAGRRSKWRYEARFVADEAEALLEAARNEVRSDARFAYAELATAHAAESVAKQSAATALELFRSVKARFEAHAATALDLSLSETQQAETESDLARARRAVVDAQTGFRHALGLPTQASLEVVPLAHPRMPEQLSREAAVTLALDQRRETAAWTSQRERWRAADARLRAEAVAPVTAGFEAERQGNRQPSSSVGASVNAELPVAWRNQGERAVARQQSSAAELERELVEQAITREVVGSYQRLETALAELAALEQRAVPAADRTLEMVGVMLQSGAIDYFRVLSARRDAFALRARRVEALREAWLSRIALERAVGGLKES